VVLVRGDGNDGVGASPPITSLSASTLVASSTTANTTETTSAPTTVPTSTPRRPRGWKTCTNRQGDFELAYPSSLATPKRSGDACAVFTLVGSGDAGLGFVSAQRAPEGSAAKTIVALERRGFDVKVVTRHGRRMHRVFGSVPVDDGYAQVTTMFVVPTSGRAVVVEWLSEGGISKTSEDELATIAASVVPE
jgi:hypothetical protein